MTEQVININPYSWFFSPMACRRVEIRVLLAGGGVCRSVLMTPVSGSWVGQIQVNAAAGEVMGPPYLAVLAVYSRADSARI